MWPYASDITWNSMCRGPSTNFSRYTAPSPKAASASLALTHVLHLDARWRLPRRLPRNTVVEKWFAALLVATALVGFILALAGFLLAFFRRRAGLGWGRSLLLSGIGILFMCFMAWLLNRDFPPGLLQEFFVLPWPFT